MQTVTSNDGTTIAFEQLGTGPALILVDGALQHRAIDQGRVALVELLAQHFTVLHYDRRGRGDSGDTQPYAVAREIEDIAALIDRAGGTAFVYGISSGAALVMEAAIALPDKIKKIALYEAPFNDDPAAQAAWQTYTKELGALLAANRGGDAVALFMRLVGATDEGIAGLRHAPIWPHFEAVGPTLAYDHIALLGAEAAVPTARAALVTIPALVMAGEASYPFMQVTAVALTNALPRGEHRTLAGQTHEVAAAALAPALVAFFHR